MLRLDAYQHDEDGDELVVVVIRRAHLLGLAEEGDTRRDDARLKGVKEARVCQVRVGATWLCARASREQESQRVAGCMASVLLVSPSEIYPATSAPLSTLASMSVLFVTKTGEVLEGSSAETAS